MKTRLLALALLTPALLWQCATPPPAPGSRPQAPRLGADDDHRSVPLAEFQAGPWKPLGAVQKWKATDRGADLTLADGRVASLTFPGPGLVRWWVPAAGSEAPLSPAARYPEAGPSVTVQENAGILALDTADLGLRLRLADLSWTLVRGDKTVLRTSGGPQAHGRRLLQAFQRADAARWVGPDLGPAPSAAKFWADGAPNPEGTGPWAVPALFGAGGALPFALLLDNSYQTYTGLTATEATLGSLNGGLDLLVAAAPRASAVVEALTAVTGRPDLPPAWAQAGLLALPTPAGAAFVRPAKLSLGGTLGPGAPTAPRLRSGWAPEQASAPLPDLTTPALRAAWWTAQAPNSPSALVRLPAYPGRQDWAATFDDGGRASPLARVHNRLAVGAAQAAWEGAQTLAPRDRPLVLANTGAPGLTRWAQAERTLPASGTFDPTPSLVLGALGLGTPALRLDLTPLAQADTKEAAFRALTSALLAPVLTLDLGPDPAAFWAALPDPDRQRLKTLLARRSAFLPFLAQAAGHSAATGVPAWTPLWFAAPADPQALACDDEYLIDDTLLAAPAPASGGHRSVYLPGPGVWFDFFTGEEFGGGRAYDLDVQADRPLLFARGGAFVPQREPEVYDGKDVFNPLTIHVFPGGFGTGAYHLDDGATLDWKAGAFWESKLTYSFAQKDMTLDHSLQHTTGRLRADPYILYRLHNVYKPRQVTINGKAIALYGDSWGVTDTDRSAAWYESDHTLLIKTFRPEMDQTILMSF